MQCRTLIRAGGISCIACNISDAGACLEVENSLGIADQFTLVIDHFQRPCHVTWKRDKRIGIDFDEKFAADQSDLK